MKRAGGQKYLILISLAWLVCSVYMAGCSTRVGYARLGLERPPDASGTEVVRVKYLGNSTLYITDGETSLLVDGFVSRPGIFRTKKLLIEPNPQVIDKELAFAGIERIDAILVGHTHYDHALDAPYIAEKFGTVVMGSKDYGNIHRGYAKSKGLLTGMGSFDEVPDCGKQRSFGDFVVTFVQSDHVESRGGRFKKEQKKLHGRIESEVAFPAKMESFQCGKVFAIHIAHRNANIAVTTSAGAKEGQWKGLKADVVFLGIGLLDTAEESKKIGYWERAVTPLDVKAVIPIHWDNFFIKLRKGKRLKRVPAKFDDTLRTIEFLRGMAKKMPQRASGNTVKIFGLDNNEEVRISNAAEF